MAEVARPPQWLFDEITMLPPEARGWALGFMCAGWLAGRDSQVASQVVVDVGDGMRHLYVPQCPCGSLKATATPSTRFEGQSGWDVRCTCGNDLTYVLSLKTLPSWLDLVAVHTSRGTMREETSDSPKE